MFFRRLGALVARTWAWWLIGWIGLVIVLAVAAPKWRDVAQGGEFNFLPPEYPSRRADDLLERAFPQGKTASSVVLVLTRREGLTGEDLQFILEELVPHLDDIDVEPADTPEADRAPPVIRRIRTFADSVGGPLLVSPGGEATLVVVELTTDLLQSRTRHTVNALFHAVEQLQQVGEIPGGLEIAFTGSAAVGRDQMQAEVQSARSIEFWTVWIIIGLLLIVYRRPLVAMLPLITLYCAVQIALGILTLLALAGHIDLFEGLDVYTRVLVYGAGVDYSLFLISRYREEFAATPDVHTAASLSLGNAGLAVTASALTVIVGIAMLTFTEYGKFQQAGVSIALGLFLLLLVSLTMTPALLRALGRWAFWPAVPTNVLPQARFWHIPLVRRLRQSSPTEGFWHNFARVLQRWPGTIFLITVLVLALPTAYGVWHYHNIAYSPLIQLPQDSPSVRGTRVLQQYFPPGVTGPIAVLLKDEEVDFGSFEGIALVETLSDRLWAYQQELSIADIRSVAFPLGRTPTAEQALAAARQPVFGSRVARARAVRNYVSSEEASGRHVTRLEIVPQFDPLSREAIGELDELKQAVQAALPEQLHDAELFFAGPSASLADLRQVAETDRTRIGILVTGSVLAVLILAFRSIVIPVYLILTVLYSYLATLGVTFAVFIHLLPTEGGFPGLFWTVPVFLFTLLVAVGEDYNIFLVDRVREEQQHHGPVCGVVRALRRTGAIISSCGIIMAGTFSVLAIGGTLTWLYQLGFALAFGVLLDTFVIRPIVVPCYLILVNRGLFGRWSKYLGAANARDTRKALFHDEEC